MIKEKTLPPPRSSGSRWQRLVIYLIPGMMDMVLAQTIFVCTLRAAKMHATPFVVSAFVGIWGGVYTLSCLVIGRFTTQKNAASILLIACSSIAVICLAFSLISSIGGMMILSVLASITTALFFPPFQIFMKKVDHGSGQSLTSSTGLYTFSWSSGFALGPFVAGYLMERGQAVLPGGETDGWKLVYFLGVATSLLAAAGIAWLQQQERKRQQGESVAPQDETSTVPPGQTQNDPSNNLPDLVWLGWLGAGLGILAMNTIRGVFPVRAVQELQLSDSVQGSIFFTMCMAQATTGLFLSFSRSWMYRGLPVLGFGLLGVAGVSCFGLGHSCWVFLLGALMFGSYCGAFFFYLVYHGLVHPHRSGWYITVNESIVGASGTIGALGAGALAEHYGLSFPYLVAAVIVLCVTLFQCWIHYRNPIPENHPILLPINVEPRP